MAITFRAAIPADCLAIRSAVDCGRAATNRTAAQASVGVSFTRNIFGLGYRYFSMDYQNGGSFYTAAEPGVLSGIGVKF